MSVQTAKVYEFPNQTKEVIETAMAVFLQTGTPAVRDLMIRTIMTEMVRTGVSRVRCENFRVWARRGGLAFDTTNLSRDGWCKCGTYYSACTLLYAHQGIDFDEHIYGCKCGYIFKVAHRRDD